MYSSIRQLYCCDITDCSRMPPERAAYKKLIKTLKNHSSCLDYPNLPKFLLLGFQNHFLIIQSLSIHPICINAWGSFSINQPFLKDVCKDIAWISKLLLSQECYISTSGGRHARRQQNLLNNSNNFATTLSVNRNFSLLQSDTH